MNVSTNQIGKLINAVLTYLHTYLHTYLLTYILTYLITYLLTYILTSLLTYLLTYLLTPWSRDWEANRFSASQEISSHFMEPEGSLPHSQVPANCPYPEPARSNPYPIPHFLKIYLNIILPFKTGCTKSSLSLRFPQPKTLYASPLPHAPLKAKYIIKVLYHI